MDLMRPMRPIGHINQQPPAEQIHRGLFGYLPLEGEIGEGLFTAEP